MQLMKPNASPPLVDSILQTKLSLPITRRQLVIRPQLLEKLNHGLKSRAILVSAPAGFGKTTLVSNWLARCSLPYAWISLDKGDDDLMRFLTYLMGALKRIDTGFDEFPADLLRGLQLPNVEGFMRLLVNRIAARTDPLLLVLDDYHSIESPAIHSAVLFLLKNLPPQLHLILITRADPPFSLARLRVNGELVEIRSGDLRFSVIETGTLLNDIMGLELTPEQVTDLQSRTEGWAAGLLMAALSLRNRSDTADFIRTFSGSHAFVIDYLAEEILQQQPAEIRSFLCRTSLLERFCASLCDELMGSDEAGVPFPDSSRILDHLERANLFLIPLDDRRFWYRYHNLFTDFLRLQVTPDEAAVLNGRAAAWFERNGLMREAIRHALAAHDFELAVQFIEQAAADVLWKQSEPAALAGWLKEIPESILYAHPRVCLHYVWALLFTMQLEQAGQYLQAVEGILNRLPLEQSRSLLGEADAARALMVNIVLGDYRQAIDLSNRALESLSADEVFVRGILFGNLGGAYSGIGDLRAAESAFENSFRLSMESGNETTALITLAYLGENRFRQGRLQEALQTYRQLLKLTSERRAFPMIGLAEVGIGQIQYERNELKSAEKNLQAGIRHCRQCMELGLRAAGIFMLQGALTLAMLEQIEPAIASGFPDAGSLDQIIADDRGATAALAVARSRLHLSKGDSARAARVLKEAGISPQSPCTAQQKPGYLMLVRIMLAKHSSNPKAASPNGAVELLDSVEGLARQTGEIGEIITSLALKALALQAMNRSSEALRVLESALALAEPEGFIRSFVDEGELMYKLWQAASSSVKVEPAASHIQTLLSSFANVWQAGGVPASPRDGLFEALSKRELEVLSLIGRGLSNAEAGRELFVAEGTIKKHLFNIYGKLGVKTRTRAIARARELKLIQ